MSNDLGNVEVEDKVVGETGFANTDEASRQVHPQIISVRKDKALFSQASDLGADMSRECCALPTETSIMEEARSSIMEALAQPSNSGEEEGDEASNDMSGKAADFAVSTTVPQSPTPGIKGKKQKGKNSQAPGSLSPSPSVSNSVDLFQGAAMEPSGSQMLAMHETLNQVITRISILNRLKFIIGCFSIKSDPFKDSFFFGCCIIMDGWLIIMLFLFLAK